MRGRRLRRSAAGARPAAPVRLLHLGLGSFCRAHQAWYTDVAPDAGDWGYAAFTGRGRGDLPERLAGQDGLYTLVTRAGDGDAVDLVSSLSTVHSGEDHGSWLGFFRSPDLAVVTVTVTEAGYRRRADGALDVDRDDVRADLAALSHDLAAPVRTAPARLVAGLAARRAAGAGPIALVPCDNVPSNGAMVDRVLRDAARRVDSGLTEWLDAHLSVVTTTVDRITPRPLARDIGAVRAATGFEDLCPVVTEPFREWVLSGAFPAGRPRWDAVGATFTDDVTPYENRKLWLLNGGHSLLAYAGSLRGHLTVDEAVGDETCRGWLDEWWDVASGHVPQPAGGLAAYRTALLERFANPRLRHRLEQIGTDGSQKLPIRILPVLRAERDAGRLPAAATRVLAAWVCCLLGLGAEVIDVRADDLRGLAAGPLPDAVRRAIHALDHELADDAPLVDAVVAQSRALASGARA
ncbi:MAG TPA: mannitol dehydrogenase family protein [Mycobacteriales bacterium]